MIQLSEGMVLIIPEVDAGSAPAAAAGHLQACSPRGAARHARPTINRLLDGQVSSESTRVWRW